jgi:hypothetical protein
LIKGALNVFLNFGCIDDLLANMLNGKIQISFRAYFMVFSAFALSVSAQEGNLMRAVLVETVLESLIAINAHDVRFF